MAAVDSTVLATPGTHFDDVQLSNGVRLHVAQQGPRTGPALLLLHGYSDSWFSFSRVLPLFRPELRVVAPDLRGHGDSSKPEAGYRITDFAGDVIQLMDALRIPNAVVLGHSMGSFVARQVAAMAEPRVPRLILMGSGPTAKTPVMRELKAAVDALTDPVDEAFVREFQLSTVFHPVAAPFIEAAIVNSRRMPAAIWRDALDGLIDHEPPAGMVFSRTLVIGGRQDQIFPPTEQMALAREFPRGELELVEGIGHALHWESPAKFMSALSRFGV